MGPESVPANHTRWIARDARNGRAVLLNADEKSPSTYHVMRSSSPLAPQSADVPRADFTTCWPDEHPDLTTHGDLEGLSVRLESGVFTVRLTWDLMLEPDVSRYECTPSGPVWLP